MLNRILNNSLIMEKALDATWLRNQVISHNIANVDTPNYKRLRVDFEAQLKEAIERDRKANGGLKTTRALKTAVNVQPRIVIERETSNRVDKNNVNIDVEMSQLTANTLMYNTLAQRISSSYSNIKNVINEGRR